MHLLPASDAAALAEAVKILRAGGVVAHATETCYGFACDLANEEAVRKLFAIKKRPPHQPVSALFASLDEAKKYVVWNDRAEELAEKHLPGPLTLILPSQAILPRLYPSLSAGAPPTLGLRLSSHPVAQALARAFGAPISTTSANVHGEPNPYAATAILERFAKEAFQPDLILDSGELPVVPPSTVIDLTQGGALRREGNIRPA